MKLKNAVLLTIVVVLALVAGAYVFNSTAPAGCWYENVGTARQPEFVLVSDSTVDGLCR